MNKIRQWVVLFLRRWWPDLGKVKMNDYYDCSDSYDDNDWFGEFDR